MPTSSHLLRSTAIAALLGSLALAAPAYAASSSSNSLTTAPSSGASTTTGKKMHQSMEDRVETRIKTLHDKLGITPDQETAWNDVAQSMRDNEAGIKALIGERHKNSQTMTAVEDLISYQKIAQAHADGLTKVASAFEPLYDNMTDTQKKNADEVFGRFEGHRGAAMMGAPTSGSKKTSSNQTGNQ